MKKILEELPALVSAQIISEEIAQDIREYYRGKSHEPQGKLIILFGILGALLTGLGIILIIAHNWDSLSRIMKTGFAFLPLVIGQLLVAFTLLKRRESTVWRESSTAFLFCSVGACIALISQIYHIPGNLSNFLLTWMLLFVPLVYLLRSSLASLLYLVGITYYACESAYWSYPSSEPLMYWGLLALILPHYYQLWKKGNPSNFLFFHHWLVPLSVIISLGTLGNGAEEWLFPAYISLFGLLYLAGELVVKRDYLIQNSYRFLGSTGSILLLLSLSFDWFWKELSRSDFLEQGLYTKEFYALLLLLFLALVALFNVLKTRSRKPLNPLAWLFIPFIGVFIVGIYFPIVAIIGVNILMLGVGLFITVEGARNHKIGTMNFGIMVIVVLIACRFFDLNLSFILRGLLFVGVGLGFFMANFWMIKRRKYTQQNKHDKA